MGNSATNFIDPSGLEGLTYAQRAYVGASVFYFMGRDFGNGVYSLFSGQAGTAMGNQIANIRARENGGQYTLNPGEFAYDAAQMMSGANGIAEGLYSVDRATATPLSRMEANSRLAGGIGAMAGSAAGGLGAASRAGISQIGTKGIPYTPNLPKMPNIGGRFGKKAASAADEAAGVADELTNAADELTPCPETAAPNAADQIAKQLDDLANLADDAGAAAKGIGAFNPGSTAAGDGLGVLANRELAVSQKGLDLVENHLKQFGKWEQNDLMLDRLRGALSEGRKISGADASFYMHEAAEATMMRRGMLYDAAHDAALSKYGVSPFSVYHPDVIRQLPTYFNSNWKKFWGLE